MAMWPGRQQGCKDGEVMAPSPFLRDQLGIVVWLPPQQFCLPPVEEVVQCHLWVGTDHDFVLVAPHLQADQGHPQAKRLIKLERETAQREHLDLSCASRGKVPHPLGKHSQAQDPTSLCKISSVTPSINNTSQGDHVDRVYPRDLWAPSWPVCCPHAADQRGGLMQGKQKPHLGALHPSPSLH